MTNTLLPQHGPHRGNRASTGSLPTASSSTHASASSRATPTASSAIPPRHQFQTSKTTRCPSTPGTPSTAGCRSPAGYAMYSNFVAQDVIVADQHVPPGDAATAYSPVADGRTAAGPRSWNLGARYRATEAPADRPGRIGPGPECLHQLVPVHARPEQYGHQPRAATRRCSTAPLASRRPRLDDPPRIVTYYRYEMYDFLDIVPGYQTGMAQGSSVA